MNRRLSVMVSLGVIAGLGCGRRESSEPGAGGSVAGAVAAAAPAASRAVALAQAADQALIDSAQLDYRRPTLAEPLDRSAVRAAFVEACRAGDPRACWIAPAIRDQRLDPETTHAEAAAVQLAEAQARIACQAADGLGCRMISDGPWIARHRPAATPEAAAAAAPCPAGDACALAELRQECKLGFPHSCEQLLFPAPPDAAAIEATAMRLEREGCKAGMPDDCRALFEAAWRKLDGAGDEVDPVAAKADVVLAAGFLCLVSLERCSELSNTYASTDPDKARDAAERACQLAPSLKDQVARCGLLVDHYVSDERYPQLAQDRWPEPVAGRGAALKAWLATHAP